MLAIARIRLPNCIISCTDDISGGIVVKETVRPRRRFPGRKYTRMIVRTTNRRGRLPTSIVLFSIKNICLDPNALEMTGHGKLVEKTIGFRSAVTPRRVSWPIDLILLCFLHWLLADAVWLG